MIIVSINEMRSWLLLPTVLFATVKVLFVGVAFIVVVDELFHFLFDIG